MKDAKNLNTRFQEFKVKGNQLVGKVREVIEEGNARRVIIKKDERVLLEFPLSVGFGGATAALLLTPQLAAIGAIAALVTDVHVIIERDVDPADADEEPAGTEAPTTDADTPPAP